MVASIQQFGFKIPILTRSDGVVVDGDLRLKAARKLGMTEVPVILCDEWSDAQVKAFRLMVNRSAGWAEWDLDLVALELQDLKAIDFDLTLTGFDPLEIDAMVFGDQEKKEEEDVVPELPAAAVTRRGDLWICGPHRVLCGDATSPDAIALLFGSIKPALMITDPPYGVEYDPTWRERAGLGQTRQSGTVANDDKVDWAAAYRLFTGDVAYVWHAGLHAGEVARGLEPPASESAHRSSGPNSTSPLAAGITTGSTSPAGTPYERASPRTGVATVPSPPCGRSRPESHRWRHR